MTNEESDRVEEPTPPASLPNYVVESMDRRSPESLRRVIAYTRELADLTPDNPVFVRDFDEDDISTGDIVKHSSSKSTVKGNKGQVARVMDEKALQIWDTDGTIRTIKLDTVVGVSKHTIDQSDIEKLTSSGTTNIEDNDQ